MGDSKVKALCVATRCATVEQFITTFHRFSDERSFFVATLNARPIGLETPFSIQLADRTPVLRGTCRVLEAWTTSHNPFKRPGIQLGIQRLTPDSERVFQQLHAARRAAPPEPITELTDSPSEAPIAVSIPPIPDGAKAARPPTTPLPAVPRTQTARRMMIEPVPAIAAPPKSPPEAKLLEVILPRSGETNVDVARPESTVETRVIEERTPGSELILPANPLQNLTDESLQGFVDCTLYEETATFFRAGDDGSEFGEPAPPPMPALPPAQVIEDAIRSSSGLFALQPSGEMIPIVVENPTTGQMSPLVVENQQRAHRTTGQFAAPELRPNRLTGPQMPVRTHRPTGQPMTVPFVMQTTGSVVGPLPTGGMAQIVMQTSGSQMGPMPTDPMAPIVMQIQPDPRRFLGDENHTPVPAGEAFVERKRRTTRLAAITTPRRWMVIGGAALGATLIFVLVLATRSSASDGSEMSQPPPPKLTTQPPIRAAEPAKVTPPKPAVVESTEVTEPTDPAGSPLVGEGPCKLDIQSTPAGTMVSIDGRSVGPSPITVAGSCDVHKIDFVHPRYKAEQRVVKMTADQVTKVDVSLVRPTHQLRVLTSPPGAEVFIGGRRAGTSPTMVQVNGFSGIDVRIERIGFKPVTKRVYSKVPDDTLAVGMTPLPRPK